MYRAQDPSDQLPTLHHHRDFRHTQGPQHAYAVPLNQTPTPQFNSGYQHRIAAIVNIIIVVVHPPVDLPNLSTCYTAHAVQESTFYLINKIAETSTWKTSRPFNLLSHPTDSKSCSCRSASPHYHPRLHELKHYYRASWAVSVHLVRCLSTVLGPFPSRLTALDTYIAEQSTDYLALRDLLFEWADSYDNKVSFRESCLPPMPRMLISTRRTGSASARS